jgi:hypothetical protein
MGRWGILGREEEFALLGNRLYLSHCYDNRLITPRTGLPFLQSVWNIPGVF